MILDDKRGIYDTVGFLSTLYWEYTLVEQTLHKFKCTDEWL